MHYGQQLEHCTLAQLWNELKLSCDFLNVRNEVNQFNINNRWRKRGIAMIPTKFGISFTAKFMNQVTCETILVISSRITIDVLFLIIYSGCIWNYWHLCGSVWLCPLKEVLLLERIHSCCMRAGAWLSGMSLGEVPVFVMSWFM